MTETSLQRRHGPDSTCFGCGPANPHGLHLESFPQDDEVVASWQPREQYEAFPGYLSGGIVGTLLDCHSNWTAAWGLGRASGTDRVPGTVTAEYTVRLLAPTPARRGPIRLRARVVDSGAHRATVESTLEADGQICATFRGTFVAVREGHPAYNRWNVPPANPAGPDSGS